MSDHDFRLVRCEQNIADLTLRIAELKSASSASSGILNSREFIEPMQHTLESRQEHKKALVLPVHDRL
jgi:hypothetical protein